MTGLRVVILSAVLAFSVHSQAQTTAPPSSPLPPDEVDRLLSPDLTKKKVNPKRMGWSPSLTLSANVSFTHSRKMVGAQDGQTWNIGPTLDASANYYDGSNEWRNSLLVREVFTRTPVIDEFVKTLDQARLDTLYLYHIQSVPWLGPYVQFRVETSFFPGEDVREKSTTYEIKAENKVFDADRLDLTHAFSPTRLKQVMGLLATPIQSRPISMEFRLGVGAQQVLVRNGLVIEDDKTTPAIELRRMHDFQQLGAECTALMNGTLLFDDDGQKRPIKYAVTASVLMPLYSSRQEGRDLTELVGVEIEAKLRFRLVRWASIDYNLRVIRAPLILDEFQVQNDVVLNLSYTLAPKEKKTPPPK